MFPSRVILIDDDLDDGYIFNLALKSISAQIEFLHIQDSEIALTTISETDFLPPDILFLDWNMPKLDGRQCLLMIRAIPGYSKIPIVIYSTAKSADLKEEARQLGASCFMFKPLSVGELITKLNLLFRSQGKELNV